MDPSKKQSGWINAFKLLFFSALSFASSASAFASEAELHIPELHYTYHLFGSEVAGSTLLGWGMVVAVLGMVFGIVEYFRIRNLPVHRSMLEVSNLIYETCKTYLLQQGKLLI